ncbi:MAG TPA: hypothetical protein VHZ30_03005 [Verrucomicrobiae bacterium]|nr:hypothetical protein [Verrucomicrobiae bacterium]
MIAQIEADRFGDSISKVVTDRLAQAFNMGPRAQAEPSALEAVELRMKEAKATEAERRAAILRGDYFRVDLVKAVIQKRFANIRSRVAQIPFQISGLSPEQVAEGHVAVEDCFTDLSTPEAKAEWDDLAKETADSI